MKTELSPPYPRTVCACAECVRCCKTQPGPLIPGDYERISALLGKPADEYLWASPGAKVMNTATRVVRQIRSITPRMVAGRCVFLDEHDRCRIHVAAPWGCAYFDTHMSAAEGQRRGLWGHSLMSMDAEYAKLRARLPLATSYKPRTL